MSKDQDLRLNAFIDGELGAAEKAEILAAASHDKELAKTLCDLRQLQQQVRLAYDDVPTCKGAQSGARSKRLVGWTTGLLLAVGAMVGWTVEGLVAPGSERFVVLDSDGRGQAPAVVGSEETRIVIHLTDPDQAAAGDLLNEIDALLTAYEHDGKPLRVELVSQSAGLALLRDRLSEHKKQIADLAERFDNLTFVACQNTITRLKVEDGIEVKLIPEAQIIHSGVSYVSLRQRQGWAYIKV